MLAVGARLLICPVVDCERSFESIRLVLEHLRIAHSDSQKKGRLRCKVDNCGKPSSTYHAYRMHVLRCHNYCASSTHDLMDNDISDIPSPSRVASTENTADPSAASSFEHDFLCFALACRERYVLPISVFNDLLSRTLSLCQQYHRLCVNARHSNNSNIDMLWVKVQNEKRFECMLGALGLVSPVQICLSETDTYQYISVLETLKAYLSHGDVLQSVNKSLADVHGQNELRDFTDGSNFHTNEFFRGNSTLLRLHLFYDDLEICNPLGSARGTHKLMCVYFMLGNVESKYLSSLRNIHPIIIAKSSVAKSYGYRKVLEPLTRDIGYLETEGIYVTTPDQETLHFKGGIATISADNLGSHEIGGFRRCFSSGRICRFCMCDYSDLRLKTSECQFQMRSQEEHCKQVSAVMDDQNLVPVFGVHQDSPFPGLKSFSVIDSLPHDIMHDIMEGVIRTTLDVILEHLFKTY